MRHVLTGDRRLDLAWTYETLYYRSAENESEIQDWLP